MGGVCTRIKHAKGLVTGSCTYPLPPQGRSAWQFKVHGWMVFLRRCPTITASPGWMCLARCASYVASAEPALVSNGFLHSLRLVASFRRLLGRPLTPPWCPLVRCVVSLTPKHTRFTTAGLSVTSEPLCIGSPCMRRIGFTRCPHLNTPRKPSCGSFITHGESFLLLTSEVS